MVNAVPLDDVFHTETRDKPQAPVTPKRPAAPDLDEDIEFTKIIRPTHFAKHSPAPAAEAAQLQIPKRHTKAVESSEPEPESRKKTAAAALTSTDSSNDTTTTVIVAILFAASTVLVLVYMHFYIGQSVSEIETTVKASYSMLDAMKR